MNLRIVERSNLAALEFLMSKQPRGNVRMTGGGNTGGVRVSNIFAEVNKFQTRFEEMKDKASKTKSKESDLQRESRVSAVQGIRCFSNWWYWQSPSSESETSLNMIHIPQEYTQTNTEKLREAVRKMKSQENARPANSSMNFKHSDEYWTPVLSLPSPADNLSSITSSSEPSPNTLLEDSQKDQRSETVIRSKWTLMSLRVPLTMAALSAMIVGNRGAENTSQAINNHIGGSVALEVVNSFEMQVVLAGITWFVIGMGIIGMLDILGIKGAFRRQ